MLPAVSLEDLLLLPDVPEAGAVRGDELPAGGGVAVQLLPEGGAGGHEALLLGVQRPGALVQDGLLAGVHGEGERGSLQEGDGLPSSNQTNTVSKRYTNIPYIYWIRIYNAFMEPNPEGGIQVQKYSLSI